MPRTGSSRSGLKDSASELKVQPPISAGEATAATNIAANSGTIAIRASAPESPSCRSITSSCASSGPRNCRPSTSIRMSPSAAEAPNMNSAPVAANVTAAAPRSIERGT